MLLGLEKIQEGLSDFGTGHKSLVSNRP